MSRSRTYTKAEIADAAYAAASHGVKVIMHPSGEIEFSPKSFTSTTKELTSAEGLLEGWKNGRKTNRGT